jgi:hypothetical protein
MLQNTLVLLCILLRTEKWQMLYRQSVWLLPSINHISAVYVTGIAGSGSVFSYTEMGLKLAVEILRDSVMNTAVLSCRYF